MSDIEKGQTTQVNDTAAGAGPATTTAARSNLVNNYDYTGPFAPRPTRIANPGALGLFSFASTTFILSLYNVNARGINTPNVVVGMAIFCGGLAQLLAGMWEFPRGNTFGGTAFSSYGVFWMSYAALFVPGSGISVAYTSKDEFDQAVGIYLMTWFIVTSLLLIAALRRNFGFIFLFFTLDLAFLFLAIGSFNGSVTVTKAGGGFGIIAALAAYYCGLSELLTPAESWFGLPLGGIPQRRVD
ncbi:Gpr1 family protein [Coniophora puteana RWD-64-598 SS2]|uniref:Gpr1 family protein n=1 Tax=Coniophora puteana (strain RWD-64-598) TaxID=741705 RepID=A0A5M3M976_CONPW|nr:Gpr1 family protein [Coniophora puteana RWD-64-598 SS2]EIW75832.1 Gpr1 family protein [Coniophora puteana RWD-64-598 SS2]